MRPMAAISGESALDGSLKESFERDGYLLVRGLLPQSEIAALRTDVLGVLQRHGWLSHPGLADDRRVAPEMACVEPEPRFRKAYADVFRLERHHRLAHHPDILAVISALLDCADLLIHPRKSMRLIFPNRGVLDFSTPAHQDFPVIQGTPETITAWSCLHPCETPEGGLMVAEGSHLKGIYPLRLANGAGGLEVADPLTSAWRTAEFQPGDVLFFHSHTVHRSGQNVSDNIRLSVDYRYQRFSDPIGEVCLDLSSHSTDWPEVYRDWRGSDLQYYWRRPGLRTLPFDGALHEHRDSIALRAAEDGDLNAISTLQRIVLAEPTSEKGELAAALLRRLKGRAQSLEGVQAPGSAH